MAFEGSFSASQIVDPLQWKSGDNVPLWIPPPGANSLVSYGTSTTVPKRMSRRPPPAHTHNDSRVRRWQSRKPQDAQGTLMSTLSGYEQSLRVAPDQSIINHHRDLRIARLVRKNVAEAKAKTMSHSLETESTAEEDKEAHVRRRTRKLTVTPYDFVTSDLTRTNNGLFVVTRSPTENYVVLDLFSITNPKPTFNHNNQCRRPSCVRWRCGPVLRSGTLCSGGKGCSGRWLTGT